MIGLYLLKFTFDVHLCFSFLVLKKFARIEQFWELFKNLDGVRALIFREFLIFDAYAVFSDPKCSILDVRACNFEKKTCKNESACGMAKGSASEAGLTLFHFTTS